MRIQFNTKRLYTQEGQVIVAEQNPATLEVQFNDVSRMVSGKFQVEVLFPTAQVLRDSVMDHYDHGLFTYTSPSNAPKIDYKEDIVGGLLGVTYD